MLIKPIQRIQKYNLLIRKILNYSEQAQCPPHVINALKDAMVSSDIIPKNANSMMDVGRLQGFTVSYILCYCVRCETSFLIEFRVNNEIDSCRPQVSRITRFLTFGPYRRCSVIIELKLITCTIDAEGSQLTPFIPRFKL